MFIRTSLVLLAGCLTLAGFQSSPEAFFMPPAVVPAVSLVTWPGDLKMLGADVSRLHDIEFDSCVTDAPILLAVGAIPGAAPGALRLRSDGCDASSVFGTLPDGVSEIRLEVTCADGGGNYQVYGVYDGSATNDQGALLPSSSNDDAYGDCLQTTASPGFRVVFEFE